MPTKMRIYLVVATLQRDDEISHFGCNVLTDSEQKAKSILTDNIKRKHPDDDYDILVITVGDDTEWLTEAVKQLSL